MHHFATEVVHLRFPSRKLLRTNSCSLIITDVQTENEKCSICRSSRLEKYVRRFVRGVAGTGLGPPARGEGLVENQ